MPTRVTHVHYAVPENIPTPPQGGHLEFPGSEVGDSLRLKNFKKCYFE